MADDRVDADAVIAVRLLVIAGHSHPDKAIIRLYEKEICGCLRCAAFLIARLHFALEESFSINLQLIENPFQISFCLCHCFSFHHFFRYSFKFSYCALFYCAFGFYKAVDFGPNILRYC